MTGLALVAVGLSFDIVSAGLWIHGTSIRRQSTSQDRRDHVRQTEQIMAKHMFVIGTFAGIVGSFLLLM